MWILCNTKFDSGRCLGHESPNFVINLQKGLEVEADIRRTRPDQMAATLLAICRAAPYMGRSPRSLHLAPAGRIERSL